MLININNWSLYSNSDIKLNGGNSFLVDNYQYLYSIFKVILCVDLKQTEDNGARHQKIVNKRINIYYYTLWMMIPINLSSIIFPLVQYISKKE